MQFAAFFCIYTLVSIVNPRARVDPAYAAQLLQAATPIQQLV
jgi:hypothetical protein